MTNVSALRGTSACCASDSARSRDEPESVRIERVTLHADQTLRARPPSLSPSTGKTSRSVDRRRRATYPG